MLFTVSSLKVKKISMEGTKTMIGEISKVNKTFKEKFLNIKSPLKYSEYKNLTSFMHNLSLSFCLSFTLILGIANV